MSFDRKKAFLISVSMILTFIALRVYLHLFPGTNFDVASYNIHHLFTGFLLLTFTGIPLILFKGNNRFLDFISILFGIGLSMVLDEWIYLITTDGSDSSYLLPISFWGGVFMIGMVFIYILILSLYAKKIKC